MAFFQKLKKLKFWTKRGKRVTKVENRKEDVNLKGESSEEDVNLKEESSEEYVSLKGESSEEDVEVNLLEHIEELKRKLEEKDATICGLEKIVEKQNIEREQMEATLRGHIIVLEETLEERDRERKKVEATLQGRIKKLENNVGIIRRKAEKQIMNWRLKYILLQEKFVDADRDKKEAESTLRAKTEYYERKQQEIEAKSENVEVALNAVIKRQQKQLEEGYRLAKEHTEYCERKQQERDAESRKMVDTLNRVINRLQKELQEAAGKHRDTLHRLYIMGAETRCEKDTATKRIKELENKVREKECERENLEPKPHCVIRDVNKKLHIRNSDKKEGESAVCGKVKKLVAAAMVVMMLMVVCFTYYGVNCG